MIIYTGKDYYDVSRKAANIMSAQIIMKPNAVLGLATGSTPVGMYKQLIEWYKKVVKKILQTGNQCGINVTTLKQ